MRILLAFRVSFTPAFQTPSVLCCLDGVCLTDRQSSFPSQNLKSAPYGPSQLGSRRCSKCTDIMELDATGEHDATDVRRTKRMTMRKRDGLNALFHAVLSCEFLFSFRIGFTSLFRKPCVLCGQTAYCRTVRQYQFSLKKKSPPYPLAAWSVMVLIGLHWMVSMADLSLSKPP